MSEYERKLTAALAELEQTGMWRSNYAPVAFRLQRRMGQQVRPPHYSGFLRIVAGYGFWFAGLWGILMWVAQWRAQGVPVFAAIISAAIAGVMFGLLIALYYRWTGRKHGLRDWDAL